MTYTIQKIRDGLFSIRRGFGLMHEVFIDDAYVEYLSSKGRGCMNVTLYYLLANSGGVGLVAELPDCSEILCITEVF